MERLTRLFLLALSCTSVASYPSVNRIVNGQIAAQGQFPFAVSIQQIGNQQVETRGHRCGGTLISFQHVLTSAKCLFDNFANTQELINSTQYRVFAGSNTLTDDTSPESTRTIANITIHDGYTGLPALVDNIAIVTLAAPFAQNIVVPLALPASNFTPPAFTPCTMVGWGGYNASVSGSAQLRYANYYVYDQRDCTAIYNGVAGALNILPSMICAVSNNIISAGCIGDDGNALICGGEFAGVLSLSDGCRSSSYPEIYTRVSNYTPWIRSIVPASSAPTLFNTGLIAMIVMSFVVHILNLSS